MATVLLIGRDEALLEGLAQMLAHAGYVPRTARTPEEAADAAAFERPLALIVERRLALMWPELLRTPMDDAGAVILYDATDPPVGAVTAAWPRAVRAELTLPHERQRLLALVEHAAMDAGIASRHRKPPPEERAR